jgi:hypothetical protein
MLYTQEQVNELIIKWDLAETTDDVEILKVLSTDKDDDVRWWVAFNRNTPVELLEILSTDEYYGVRRTAMSVLKNRA